MKNKKILIFLLIISLTSLNASSLNFIGIEKSKETQVKDIEKPKEKSNWGSLKEDWQTIKSGVQTFVKKKNEVLNKMESALKKSGLPIKFDAKGETKIMDGSYSWSLVNEKCQIDPKAVFQKSIKDLVKKYKQIWKQLKDKGFWEMYAINKSIDLLVTTISKKNCRVKIFKEHPEVYKFYKSVFDDCLQKKLKGIYKQNTGATTGTSNTANTSQGLDLKGVAMATYYAATCMGIADKKVFREAFDACVEEEKGRLLGWINGKIDLGMKLNLGKFKIEQQSCILKKYNMELSMQDILMDAFDLKGIDDKKGSTLVVTKKNTAVNDPRTQSGMVQKIGKNFIEAEKKVMKKEIQNLVNIISVENKNFTNNSFLNKEKAFLTYYAYNRFYINWLVSTFGFSKHPIHIEVSKNGSKIIDGYVFADRWVFPIYLGVDRHKIMTDPLFSSIKNQLVTENISSVTDICYHLVHNSDIIAMRAENYLFFDGTDPVKQNDDLDALAKIEGLSDLDTLSSFKGSIFQFYYTLFKSKNNNKLIQKIDETVKNKFKFMALYENKYLNYLYIQKMIAACNEWATKMKLKIDKELPKIIMKDSLASKISKGKKVSKTESEIVESLKEAKKEYILQIQKILNDIIKYSNTHLFNYSEYLEHYKKQIKEKSEELRRKKIMNYKFHF